MMYFHNYNRGFTLIERLVLLALIGALAAIVVTSTSRSKAASRDAERVGNLSVIQNALNLYFASTHAYPSTLSSLVPTYLPSVPRDPSTNAPYVYAALDTNSVALTCETYHLGAILERSGVGSLTQDADKNVLNNVCTGSAADFYGVSTNCGSSSTSPDQCFDLTSQ